MLQRQQRCHQAEGGKRVKIGVPRMRCGVVSSRAEGGRGGGGPALKRSAGSDTSGSALAASRSHFLGTQQSSAVSVSAHSHS